MNKISAIIIVLLLFVQFSKAEDEIPVVKKDSVLVSDTVIYQPGNLFLNSTKVTDSANFEYKLTQRPMTALLKSVAVPGWGQLGNKRYVKAGIFFSLDAWMVFSAVHYGRQASDFRKKFDNTPIENIDLRNQYHELYDDRRDERNKFTWFAVIVTFFSMFDAYVDAHLSGSPIEAGSNHLSFDLKTDEDNGTLAVISLNF